MNVIKASLVFAALSSLTSLAHAASDQFEPSFGSTLPPVGYVRFCARNPADCRTARGHNDKLAVTPELWEKLYTINTRVNTAIAPQSDQDLYGVPEFWAYPKSAGDCEDYVLQKQKELSAAGIPNGNLLITVVRDEKGEGHAVLTVATSEGDYVLDNRRNDIRTWNDTGYKFLKRQSARDPKAWEALTAVATSVATVAGNKK